MMFGPPPLLVKSLLTSALFGIIFAQNQEMTSRYPIHSKILLKGDLIVIILHHSRHNLRSFRNGPNTFIFLLISADLCSFSEFFQKLLSHTTNMTSRDYIFTKLSQNISFLYILPVSKSEVIWIRLAKVMDIDVF